MLDQLKRSLLAIVPPYSTWVPPLGIARLMGHLKEAGCDDFDFIDFRLWTSDCYAPTYNTVGTYGETFVVDVPDLPLVLRLLGCLDAGTPISWEPDPVMESYAFDRGIHPAYLARYLSQLDRFLDESFENIPAPDFIGFSTWSSNFLTTLMAARHVKERRKDSFVVLGGPAVSLSRPAALLALRSGLADAVVVGEGEESLLELYQAFRNGGDISEVQGVLSLHADGSVCEYQQRPLMRLDRLAMPDFSCMPVHGYQTHGYPLTILPFEISRGCTDKCSFCSEWVLWRRFRISKTDPIIDRMEELMGRYGGQAFWFRDSLMNGVPGRFEEFCNGILSRGLQVKWMGYARANFDDESARLAHRAGMETTYVGIESLDDRTLELMNKRRTGDDNLRSLFALLDAGIRVRAGFIPGFPGSSRESVRSTARVLGRLQDRYRGRLTVNTEAFTPYAGQPILDALDDYGLEPHAWSDEVVDLAPRYADITATITEKVSGRSQGLDRIGMQREVETIASAGIGSHGENGDVFVTRANAEDIHDHKLTFDDLGRGLWLAKSKSPNGLRRCLIFTDKEKTVHERTGRLQPTDDERVDELTVTIAAQHIGATWTESESTPSVPLGTHPTALGPILDDTTHFMLSPFAVARQLDDVVLIVEQLSKHRARLAGAWRPVLEALRNGLPTLDALRAVAPPDQDPAELLPVLGARGLVVAHTPRAAAFSIESANNEPEQPARRLQVLQS